MALISTVPPPRKGKQRYCWNCGDDMGFVEDRNYHRLDTCGSMECYRALQAEIKEERREAHERLDRDNGWD